MTTPVGIRLSSAELEDLKREAELRGNMSLSALIRQMLFAAREQELGHYRLDSAGRFVPGKYDFSTDVIAAGRKGDADAKARVLNFLQVRLVSAADVAALNPAQQRGEDWVAQRSFAYPLWSAIAKPVLEDSTPFLTPKFVSATGLVAAHTEGVEPVPGTFVTANQTVTPTPVSGKASITREAWDAGGDPKLSQVIWDQIQRAWFEHLESAAASLLEAAAPTVITLTTAAVDAALADSFDSQVIPLAFVRGGQQMRELVLQTDLYQKLSMAKDSTGRRLYERVPAPQGDSGAAVVVGDALLGKAGWALAPTGNVAANSYLFDRAAVSGWATSPQRLTFDARAVSTVEVAVWGWKATAITDLTGVRRITYDPV